MQIASTAIVIAFTFKVFLLPLFNIRGKYSNIQVLANKKALRKYGRHLLRSGINIGLLFYRNRDAYFIPVHAETIFCNYISERFAHFMFFWSYHYTQLILGLFVLISAPLLSSFVKNNGPLSFFNRDNKK